MTPKLLRTFVGFLCVSLSVLPVVRAQIAVEDEIPCGDTFHGGIEFAPMSDRAYVSTGVSVSRIHAVDLASHAIVDEFAADSGSFRLSPDEQWILTRSTSSMHRLYDTSDSTQGRLLFLGSSIGEATTGLEWSGDGRRAYVLRKPTVVGGGSGTLYSIDPVTAQVVDTLVVPNCSTFVTTHFALDPVRARAVVVQGFGTPQDLAIIDLETLTIEATVAQVGDVREITFSEDGKTAWIADASSDRVRVLDMVNAAFGTPIDIAAAPLSVTIDEAARQLVAVSETTVEVHDLDSGAALASVPAAGLGRVAVVPFVGTGIAARAAADQILVIDLDRNSSSFGTVVQTLGLPGCSGQCLPTEVALHPSGARAYVLGENRADVAVLSLPRPPVSIDIVPERIHYSAGERVRLHATVENHTQAMIPITGWVDVIEPNGQPFPGNPVLGQ